MRESPVSSKNGPDGHRFCGAKGGVSSPHTDGCDATCAHSGWPKRSHRGVVRMPNSPPFARATILCFFLDNGVNGASFGTPARHSEFRTQRRDVSDVGESPA